MNTENKNMLLAIVLSAIVLIGRQYLIECRSAAPHEIAEMERQKQEAAHPAAPGKPATEAKQGGATVPGTADVKTLENRAAVIASTPRLPIDTPRYTGSIGLKGGRLDDLALKTYRQTIDPNSPMVIMLSPSGTPIRPANAHDVLENEGPYYADFGWATQPGSKLPSPVTPSGRRSRKAR